MPAATQNLMVAEWVPGQTANRLGIGAGSSGGPAGPAPWAEPSWRRSGDKPCEGPEPLCRRHAAVRRPHLHHAVFQRRASCLTVKRTATIASAQNRCQVCPAARPLIHSGNHHVVSGKQQVLTQLYHPFCNPFSDQAVMRDINGEWHYNCMLETLYTNRGTSDTHGSRISAFGSWFNTPFHFMALHEFPTTRQ